MSWAVENWEGVNLANASLVSQTLAQYARSFISPLHVVDGLSQDLDTIS
jgi:hypothetical protein